MWDFIKLFCVEGNGSAWVDAAVMTSAKGDQFVLSNLCHLSAPTQQPVLKTRAGEAETEKITLDNKVLSAEPSSDRERPVHHLLSCCLPWVLTEQPQLLDVRRSSEHRRWIRPFWLACHELCVSSTSSHSLEIYQLLFA